MQSISFNPGDIVIFRTAMLNSVGNQLGLFRTPHRGHLCTTFFYAFTPTGSPLYIIDREGCFRPIDLNRVSMNVYHCLDTGLSIKAAEIMSKMLDEPDDEKVLDLHSASSYQVVTESFRQASKVLGKNNPFGDFRGDFGDFYSFLQSEPVGFSPVCVRLQITDEDMDWVELPSEEPVSSNWGEISEDDAPLDNPEVTQSLMQQQADEEARKKDAIVGTMLGGH